MKIVSSIYSIFEGLEGPFKALKSCDFRGPVKLEMLTTSKDLVFLGNCTTKTCSHKRYLILSAFITGNSSLEPLIEGLCTQIHVNLR